MKFEIINLASLSSTNTYLFDLISQKHCEEGILIKTDNQTKGKGLGTNKWESEVGKNLNFSFLLTPEFLKPEQQFAITQIVSVSILNACRKQLNNEENLTIKWPNDIYSGDKKLAGVLVQNVIKGNYISNSVIGIGLNVNQQEFFSDAPNPVSLIQIADRSFKLDFVLTEILTEIKQNYEKLRLSQDYSWLETKYLGNLYRFNQAHFFTDKSGKFEGKIIGIDNYGQLKILKTDEQTVLFGYKEVEFSI